LHAYARQRFAYQKKIFRMMRICAYRMSRCMNMQGSALIQARVNPALMLHHN